MANEMPPGAFVKILRGRGWNGMCPANQFDVVFCDIDGTFLNSKHEVTEKTKREVQRIIKMGIPFVLTSSRMPEAIVTIQKMAGITQPIIAYGGGLILDQDEKIIYSQGLNPEEAFGIGSFIKNNFPDVTWNIYSGHKWLCEAPKCDRILREEIIIEVQAEQGSLAEILQWETVHKILCMGEPDRTSLLQEHLQNAFPALSISKSTPNYLEITSGTANKGNAIKTYCRLKNLSLRRTLAFGDGYNDMDMFHTAGTSYAMANAPEEIRKLVGNVTLDNDHDGIAHVIEKLF